MSSAMTRCLPRSLKQGSAWRQDVGQMATQTADERGATPGRAAPRAIDPYRHVVHARRLDCGSELLTGAVDSWTSGPA